METITTSITDNKDYIICSSTILVNEGIINLPLYHTLVSRILNHQQYLYDIIKDDYILDVLHFLKEQGVIKSSILYRVNDKFRFCISCDVFKEQHVEVVFTYKKRSNNLKK